MQSLVNAINSWCIKNDMKLNQSKCKDMIISFEKDRPKLDQIFVNNHEIVPVSSAKFLGTYISAQWRSQGGGRAPRVEMSGKIHVLDVLYNLRNSARFHHKNV
jgi:hypothetical protein